MSEEIFKYNQYFNYEGDPSSYQINIPSGGSMSAPPAAASPAAGMNTNQLAQLGLNAATGGTAQAVMGGLQTLYGLSQLPKARAEFERARAAAPSLETPAQFYENYKNAYDATLAGMERDAIQANLATSVQALQGAGGRALVGGLSQATAQSQLAQNRMLGQERQMRLQAGQSLAKAEERSIARQEARNQREQAYANQAYQAALGNIGGGLSAVGTGLMYSGGLKGMGIGGGDGKLAEKAGNLADKAASGIKKGAGVVADKAQQGANYLKERVNYEMDMMPERINNFQTQRAIKKTLKQAQKRGNPPMMVNSITPKSINPSDVYTPNPASMMQPMDMTKPAPVKRFSDLAPVLGSAIPKEFQNEQALKQFEALGKMYDNVSPVLNSALPVQPQAPISYQQIPMVNEYLPLLGTTAFLKKGGMVTDGEFSHETNPIDIMQDGAKVGEMTGGEYIINPTQASKIAKESSYARKLFKRFEKKAKKNK